MTESTRKSAKNLWHLVFEWRNSIWSAVLPYCILNCLIMVLIELLAMWDIKIAFSPSGHGLMTLIVSFLVINKVNLAYDRYMQSRHAIGHALSSLRELNQSALLYTESLAVSGQQSSSLASDWRIQTATRIVDLMDCTVRVIRDPRQANYLARNVDIEWKTDDDPMCHVRALRAHLYSVNLQVIEPNNSNNASSKSNNTQPPQQTHSPPVRLELFERMKLIDGLNEFVVHYRNLLKCASTPLSFQLVQMGRTFLFLWTFTIPLVLRGVVGEIYSAMTFVFFLTYGFVGLELVSMKLMNPFGDGANDLNVTGMKEATRIGMEKDLLAFGESTQKSILGGDKRLAFGRNKPRPPMKDTTTANTPVLYDENRSIMVHNTDTELYNDSQPNDYHPMGDHHAAIFQSPS